MATLFMHLERWNRAFCRRFNVSPKNGYAVGKAYWSRFLRDLIGVQYSKDATAVNIVLDDVQAIYSGIPKTGTKTFLQELMENNILGENVRVYNKPLASLLERSPELKGYYSFSFVRNPWARVVSVYNSKICHPNIYSVRTYFVRYKGLRHKMPFQEFVEWLCCSDEGKDESADRHWISQHLFLYQGNKLLVDRVSPFEDMSTEWEEICGALSGRKCRLGHYSRKTSSSQGSYREYYDKRLANLVAQRYTRDIEIFGYSF